jgi:hypothetical protein
MVYLHLAVFVLPCEVKHEEVVVVSVSNSVSYLHSLRLARDTLEYLDTSKGEGKLMALLGPLMMSHKFLSRVHKLDVWSHRGRSSNLRRVGFK